MFNVAGLIQARMGSTRYPGKVLRPLAGVPMIEHIINRLRTVPELDGMVLAVPLGPLEQPLAEIAHRLGIEFFQGPEEDVLQRFIRAGDFIGAEHIVRVCGDNPLVDPELAGGLIRRHLEKKADYTLPAHPIPLGTGTEVVRLDALKKIAENTRHARYLEHVTTYFHDYPESFILEQVEVPDYLRHPAIRLTVDTEQDFILLDRLYEEFFTSSGKIVDLKQVIAHLKAHPELTRLNANVVQKDWRK
ncbi:MAG: cytidylyltransferase domain-containing protein [Nitrospinaceae bacterium]